MLKSHFVIMNRYYVTHVMTLSSYKIAGAKYNHVSLTTIDCVIIIFEELIERKSDKGCQEHWVAGAQ